MMRTLSIFVLLGALLAGGTADAQLTRRPIVVEQRPRILAPARIIGPAPSTPAPAPRAEGELRCEVMENGSAATASFVARQANQIVASGSCASPARLAAGSYDVALTLDDALDRPTRTVVVQVAGDATAVARASFDTAILEVRFTKDRAAVPGLAIVRRNGVQLGTIGSGVATRLSAGSYEIVARYRTEERTFTVALAAGQRRALRADF